MDIDGNIVNINIARLEALEREILAAHRAIQITAARYPENLEAVKANYQRVYDESRALLAKLQGTPK